MRGLDSDYRVCEATMTPGAGKRGERGTYRSDAGSNARELASTSSPLGCGLRAGTDFACTAGVACRTLGGRPAHVTWHVFPLIEASALSTLPPRA